MHNVIHRYLDLHVHVAADRAAAASSSSSLHGGDGDGGSFLARASRFTSPGRARHESRVATAREVESRLCVQRDSVLTSMAWRPRVLAAVQRHGFLECRTVDDADGDVDPRAGGDCEVCGRRGHSASHRFVLRGRATDLSLVLCWVCHRQGRWPSSLGEEARQWGRELCRSLPYSGG